MLTQIYVVICRQKATMSFNGLKDEEVTRAAAGKKLNDWNTLCGKNNNNNNNSKNNNNNSSNNWGH